MTSIEQESASLAQRVECLEAELARMRRIIQGRSVQAESFVLAGPGGMARGWFAVNDDGCPEFRLAHRDGTVRAELVLGLNGEPRIVLYDTEGKQRAALQVADNNEPSLYLWDESGVNMIALRTLVGGTCEAVLNGGVKGRLRLATDSEGASRMELLDEDQIARIAIRSADERAAELVLRDEAGEIRAELFVESDGAGELSLRDHEGRRRTTASVDATKGADTRLRDRNATRIAALPSALELTVHGECNQHNAHDGTNGRGSVASVPIAQGPRPPSVVYVYERLRDIVATRLGCQRRDVTITARFIEDLGADSLHTIELLMEIEQEFNIDIPDEEAEKLCDVRSTLFYLWNRLIAP